MINLGIACAAGASLGLLWLMMDAIVEWRRLVASGVFKRCSKCPAPPDVICIHGRLMQGDMLWGHCLRCTKATGGLPR